MRLKIVAAFTSVLLAAPVVAVADPVGEASGCDPIDPARCLLPFPNDYFTVADAATVTGRRINISPLATPRALQGAKPILTDELNRNDGFSPGSMILTFVPGLDLHQTWGTSGITQPAHRDHIADISRYAADDAPILIINASTGQRHPFWSELDTHPATPDGERLLILRPAVNFLESGRYLVALRNLKDADGNIIPAGDAFAAYLAGDQDDSRQADITRIVEEIGDAEAANGFDADELFLAWEFTVASWQNLAGRALHIRDDAFGRLGDTNLADQTIQGSSPAFRVERIEPGEGSTKYFVHGKFTVPNYLIAHAETPEVFDPTGQITGDTLAPVYPPHTRFFYPPGSDLPAVNPAQPTIEANFTCRVPATASATNPARPILMGHGLLGQRLEVGWNSGNLLTAQHNRMYCGTEWIGMAFGDLPQAVTILLDPSFFPSLADRSQQGFVNFMYLGRLMIHAQGFVSHAAFQDNGTPLVDTTQLVYDGNSQGGIMGGALTALAPDFTRATLGVVGMNYSTLLNRSVDWEGEFAIPFYASIPDKRDQQIAFSLIQMLWDRAEANGYAHHMTTANYPNTPAHQVLLHVAYGDYQVANVSAEVEARTIGARLLQRSMPASRHWSVDPGFDFGLFPTDGEGNILPWGGSALVYWDSGNPSPPNGNVPPTHLGKDPHEDPRRDPQSGVQRVTFFDSGQIIDVAVLHAYCTNEFSRHPELFTVCPSS